jgi:hypothetical protein
MWSGSMKKAKPIRSRSCRCDGPCEAPGSTSTRRPFRRV